MKINLSWIYFRQKWDNWFENVCFEDLQEEKQEEILASWDPEFIKWLCRSLAKTIVRLWDQFDMVSG